MAEDSWTRIEALFAGALERPTELRATYVRAESPDEQTANEVLSLIDASSKRGRLDSLTDQLRRLSVPAQSYGIALKSRLGDALAGRYRIECELGRGGMAIVFLADDLKHHRKLALKLLAPGLAFGVGATRFLQEIAFAAQLAHPHILPMHDSGEVDDLLFYVMPYVEGESLRDRLVREHRLPLVDALTIAREVADAIGYAHSRNVVHRDIKPENILLLAGHAVIADFGIASAISAAGLGLSDTGVFLGTPAYMSPEQVTRDASVDGRTDVYALGCVLFEMLTGAAPFAGENVEAILAQKLTGPPPSDRAREPLIPEHVERTLNRALAIAPGDRFATAEEFADEIDQALRTTWQTWAPSRLLTRLVIAALVLGILLAGGFAWRSGGRGVARARVASLVVLPFENLSGDPAREYFVDGMHEAINNELAQIGALRVISRTSSMHYKATTKSVPQIARELNVGAVLEGSVFSVGDSVRIQVELIQAAPEERHLWARTYDRHVRDVLALHRELARNVAEQVRVALTPSEERRLAATRVVRPEAYTAYLKGQYFAKRWQIGGCRDAERYFQEAIALDSTFADAYAGLAHCYILPHPDARTQREFSEKARGPVLKALQLDSNLALAHVIAGFIEHRVDYDWKGAEAEFRRALALNEEDQDALRFFGEYLYSAGRHKEGLAMVRRAVELDPFNLDNSVALGFGLYMTGRFDESIRELQRTLEMDRNWFSAYLLLALSEAGAANHDSAVAAQLAWLRSTLQPARAAPITSALTETYAASGWRAFWERDLALCKEDAEHPHTIFQGSSPCAPYWVAQKQARLGDGSAALASLEAARDERSVHVIYINVDPIFAPFRAHARMQRLMREINVPQ